MRLTIDDVRLIHIQKEVWLQDRLTWAEISALVLAINEKIAMREGQCESCGTYIDMSLHDGYYWTQELRACQIYKRNWCLKCRQEYRKAAIENDNKLKNTI